MARGRKTGGRTKGTPNKATVVVRADLKEISDQTGRAGPTVIAYAMGYYFELFESCKAAASIPGIGPEEQWANMTLAETYLDKAAHFAKDLAPYQAPRLSSVKVGDPADDAPLQIKAVKFSEADCITREEYRAEQAKLVSGFSRTNGPVPEDEHD
jgi:hypothetical protein